MVPINKTPAGGLADYTACPPHTSRCLVTRCNSTAHAPAYLVGDQPSDRAGCCVESNGRIAHSHRDFRVHPLSYFLSFLCHCINDPLHVISRLVFTAFAFLVLHISASLRQLTSAILWDCLYQAVFIPCKSEFCK
jgi:hypothetical protein